MARLGARLVTLVRGLRPAGSGVAPKSRIFRYFDSGVIPAVSVSACSDPSRDSRSSQAARTRGLNKRGQPAGLKKLAQRHRGGAYNFELVWFGRIEIESHAVRIIGPVGPAEPHVLCDHRLVGEVDQRGGIVADDMANHAVLLGKRNRRDPIREIRPGVLLKESLARYAVRKTLHRDRPAFKIREHGGRDVFVIFNQLAFGDSVFGKKNLIRPCEGGFAFDTRST